MEIAAGQFKAQCLSLMDRVQQTREEILITKRGQPIAKLVPLEQEQISPLMGYMQGTVTVNGDIIAPVEDQLRVQDCQGKFMAILPIES